MTNTSISIKYQDIAPEAKENFDSTITDKMDFVDLEQLKNYNLNVPNYANPCEEYNTLLNGSCVPIADNPENTPIGIWSESLSDEYKNFPEPIVLTLTANGQYTTEGLTFSFDTYNQIHPKNLNIKWYRDNELLVNKEFQPDNAFYFCKEKVNNFNKLVITFYNMNMPNARLKIQSIDFGYGTIFNGDELRNAKVIQEIDPLSTEIYINTFDFTLESKRKEEPYNFQTKQPLTVYFNNKLITTSFVKSYTRTTETTWNISSEDYIGIMEDVLFWGDVYTNKNAIELMEEIFNKSKVYYNISNDFVNVQINGYIPICSCRDALVQVAFAIGAVVDTSGSNVVNVYKLSDDITQNIPLGRIMQGQSFTDETKITGVELISHEYIPITETITAYEAQKSGTGNNILVEFTEPLHTLKITNGSIQENTANYAIITANNTNCVLTGQKYQENKVVHSKKNPLVLATEKDRIAKLENMTLVNNFNVANLLTQCYNYLIINEQVNLKIVEGRKYDAMENSYILDNPVYIGDVITCETQYLGEKTGRIIKQSYNLNGGIIIKDSILK